MNERVPATSAVITGAGGFIGDALVSELLDSGYQVHALVRPGSPTGQDIETNGAHVVPCDLADTGQLATMIDAPCDVFLHCGWQGTARVQRADAKAQIANISSTLAAVEVAASLGCTSFIGVGSQAEYGNADGVLAPDSPTIPPTFYGAAKLGACHLSRLRARALGMRHLLDRLFSVYGPCAHEDTLVMSVWHALLEGRSPRLTSCDQLWDYLFRDDAALALRCICEQGRDGAVYCVGSGIARPLADYVEMIRDAVNPAVELRFGEIAQAPSRATHLEADVSALFADTGFVPRVPFETGIRRTVDWCVAHRGGQLR